MSYLEREISRDDLEKFLQTLDSDEGIRMDVDSYHIFVNKTSKVYCINISKENSDEFIYKSKPDEVLVFLDSKKNQNAKFFVY